MLHAEQTCCPCTPHLRSVILRAQMLICLTPCTDAYSLFFIELLLFNFVELRRFQDYRKPGSMGKQYLLGLENGLKGSGDPAYPGALLPSQAHAAALLELPFTCSARGGFCCVLADYRSGSSSCTSWN